jgi:Protein of unknown function (DUF3533)
MTTRQRSDEGLGHRFWAELHDAGAWRAIALVTGVLALQMGFIASYVGAFHQPTPHSVPITVVAPGQVADQTAAKLNAIDGTPLKARAVSDRASAERALRDDETSAVLILDPRGTRDTLLVASGGGAAVVTAVQTLLEQAERSQGRTLAVRDVVPLQAGDGRGLTGFYLVIGWVVGGYLLASLLAIATGARTPTRRRTLLRLGLVAVYAAISGLGGALIVDQGIGAMQGHWLALWGLGFLVVAASATVTLAFEALLGVIGIGVTILLFVILGNPAAGGAYQADLLPGFWRVLADVLPNGAAVESVRRIVYFGGVGILGHVLVIAAWVVAGAVVALAASRGQREETAAATSSALPPAGEPSGSVSTSSRPTRTS